MQELERRFRAQWQKLKLPAHAKVLVAVSTGADSMALLWLLAHLPPELRPQINVAYVDHQLRAQSRAETAYIQQYCKTHGYPLFIKTWPKEAHPKTGLEEQARRLRYAFFEAILAQQDIGYLVTAHHSDDQAETFLMKLLRGGLLAQLTGIKASRPFGKAQLIRPLLGFSKAQLVQLVQSKEIKYFEDETNASDATLRNRLRHHVVPRLKQENPQFLAHVESYTEQLEDLLAVATETLATQLAKLTAHAGDYELAAWQKLSVAWQRQLLRHLFATADLEVSEKKVQQAWQLLTNPTKPQGSIALGKDYFFFKEYGRFGLAEKCPKPLPDTALFELELGRWHSLVPTYKLGLFWPKDYQAQPGDEVLVVKTTSAPFYVRHRRPGDRMQTAVGKQKIKKILVDHKLPQIKRDNLWLVTDATGNVCWIVGVKKTDLSPRLVNAKMHYIIVLRKEENDDE